MRINMISESEISVRGHGVHTAFLELVHALRTSAGCEVIVNKFLKRVPADVTHIHTIGLPSLGKLFFGSGVKVVSAHVVPASLVGSIVGAEVWLPVAKAYMKFFYSRADAVLAVSSMVADVLKNDFGIAPEKVFVTHNTIDTKQYKTTPSDKEATRKALGIDKSAFVVAGNGQIQPRKRFDVFVSMAKAQPSLEFIWIGGIPFKNIGADYKKMQELIDSAPENLKVTGVIELADVKQYLQAADVFVLPAEQENHPMAVIEAAAVGLPLVLRDIPEYDDTFQQDIARCKSDKDFETVVLDLKKDKAMRDKYSKSAEKVAKRFDSSQGAKEMVTIYKKVVGKKSA